MCDSLLRNIDQCAIYFSKCVERVSAMDVFGSSVLFFRAEHSISFYGTESCV